MPVGSAFRERRDETITETTDDVSAVVLSFTLGEEKIATIEVKGVSYDSGMTTGATGKITGTFARRTGQNIIRVGTPLLQAVTTTWSAPQPTLDVVANTQTQSIDIVVKGKAATYIRWYLKALVEETA